MHARDPFEEPAGGGAVAAVQLARLAGECVLVSALGDDEHGRRSVERLGELGVHVRAARRAAPTGRRRRSWTTRVSARSSTFGARLEPLGERRGAGAWSELAKMDAVYFTAGDLGALRAARAARVLVASPRATDALGQRRRAGRAGAERERRDRARRGRPRAGTRPSWSSRPRARVAASTGSAAADRARGRPPRRRATTVDSYGCGDSFAAGLTYALGAGMAAPAGAGAGGPLRRGVPHRPGTV